MEWTSISERLVDYFLIIGPGRGAIFDKPKGRKTSFGNRLNSWYKVSHPVPTILRRFPETDYKDSELPFDVTYFCQPNGCCADVREPRSHIFMLTDTETNIHTYGVCLSLPHLFGSLTSTQEGEVLNSDSICIQEWGVLSICILSRHPFFDFFEKSLNTLFHFVEHFCGKDFNWNTLIQARYQPSDLHGNIGNMVEEIEEWINGLISLKAPVPCESALEVELEVDPATVVCYPPSSRLPLLELPVHKIFRRLGVCNVLEIFKLVLSEQKVILHSEDPAFVTECVLTIVGLLYPLQYLFPIIPLLPTSMPTAENLWDTRSWRNTMTLRENKDFISDMVTDDERRTLLATSGDGSLTAVDLRQRRLEQQSDHTESELLSLALVKGGRKVVCGDGEGSLMIYHWGLWGDITDRYPGHPQAIDCLVKISDSVMCTGCMDGGLRSVHVLPNQILANVGHHSEGLAIDTMCLTHDKTFLVTCSQDSCKFWAIEDIPKLSPGGEGDDSCDGPQRKRRKRKQRQRDADKEGDSATMKDDFFADLCS